MDVVLVKERGIIYILEGEGTVSSDALSLRSRLSGGDIEYYLLKHDPSFGMSLDAHVKAINRNHNLLEKSGMISKI